MKKIVFGFVCYFVYAIAHAQEEPPSIWACKVSWFLPTEQASTSERTAHTALLFQHAQDWAGKKQKAKNDRHFLAKMFHKTHKKFLKKYKLNTPFAKTIQQGTYDCVSSTALFALMLEYAKYDYQIFETPNHVYIKVQTSKGVILLETTNRTWGFVKYTKEINALEQSYHLLASPKAISLKELAGLQFYNQALDAIQKENYAQGTKLLCKAKMLYNHSERIKRLSFLVGKL